MKNFHAGHVHISRRAAEPVALCAIVNSCPPKPALAAGRLTIRQLWHSTTEHLHLQRFLNDLTRAFISSFSCIFICVVSTMLLIATHSGLPTTGFFYPFLSSHSLYSSPSLGCHSDKKVISVCGNIQNQAQKYREIEEKGRGGSNHTSNPWDPLKATSKMVAKLSLGSPILDNIQFWKNEIVCFSL